MRKFSKEFLWEALVYTCIVGMAILCAMANGQTITEPNIPTDIQALIDCLLDPNCVPVIPESIEPPNPDYVFTPYDPNATVADPNSTLTKLNMPRYVNLNTLQAFCTVWCKTQEPIFEDWKFVPYGEKVIDPNNVSIMVAHNGHLWIDDEALGFGWVDIMADPNDSNLVWIVKATAFKNQIRLNRKVYSRKTINTLQYDANGDGKLDYVDWLFLDL